jgi:hypothetical protein
MLCNENEDALAAVKAEVRNNGSGSGNNAKNGVPFGSKSLK